MSYQVLTYWTAWLCFDTFILSKSFLRAWGYLVSLGVFLLTQTFVLCVKWISSCEVVVLLCKPEIVFKQMIWLLTLLSLKISVSCQWISWEKSWGSWVIICTVLMPLKPRVCFNSWRWNEAIWPYQSIMHALHSIKLWVIQQVLNKSFRPLLRSVRIEQCRVHFSDFVSQIRSRHSSLWPHETLQFPGVILWFEFKFLIHSKWLY